ncbi:hypothetical protein FRC12_022911 [Ceratobasidium sp. 428]|nr:hypothetical protein FRC12_022911 [Ceratobasidium sp. 428]
MKKLQPDPTEQSAATLMHISRTLVAISNNQTVPLSSLPNPGLSGFSPLPSLVLVNVLWLSSLIISVGVSLMAMLAKKWCHVFLSARSGPYNEQARRRQNKWDGIVWWRMRGVMDLLPLLMHLALALFATGLVVYLMGINKRVAVAVAVIASVFGVIYAAATVLPLFFDTCPYGTLLSEPLKPVIVPLARGVALVLVLLFLLLTTPCLYCACVRDKLTGKWLEGLKRVLGCWEIIGPVNCASTNDLILTREPFEMTFNEELAMDTVTSRILAWLIQNSENRNHVNLALQAISAGTVGLPMGLLRSIGVEAMVDKQLARGIVDLRGSSPTIHPASSPKEVSSSFRVLSRIYSAEFWHENHHDNDFSAVGRRIVVLYDLLARHGYLDPSRKPNTFMLHASALMLAYSWLPQDEADEYSPLLCKAVVDILWIIERHIDQVVILKLQALSAFVEGCAHYLIRHISKNDHSETVQRLILELLRLYAGAGEGFGRLKYTVALTLASSAAAGRLYGQSPEVSSANDTGTARGVRLFAEYIPANTELSRQDLLNMHSLLFFGIFGVSELLPFASVNSQLIGRLFALPEGWKDWHMWSSVRRNTVLDRLNWHQFGTKAGLACLVRVPDLNGFLDAENALAEFLRAISRRVTTLRAEDGSDQAVSAAITQMCHARSAKIWHSGLNFLGLSAIQNARHLDAHSVYCVTHLRLAEHLFEVSVASNPRSSPQAMKHLWGLIQLVLRSVGLTPNTRITALGSLLRNTESSKLSSNGLPRTIDDIQLEPIWHEALESMISSGDAPKMDGEIIHVMIKHYGKTEATVTGSGEMAINNRDETLQKWQRLDALFKSERKIRACKQWAMLWILLKCKMQIHSRRKGE